MTNKDIIKQYVNIGNTLPEYQLNKLSISLLKTYFRKRLIRIGNIYDPSLDTLVDMFLDYEYKLIIKYNLLDLYVSFGYQISLYELNEFPKNILNLYLQKRIEVACKGKSIHHLQYYEYRLMNNDLINKCAENSLFIPEFSFMKLSDDFKFNYIKNMINKYSGKNISLKEYMISYSLGDKTLRELLINSGIRLPDFYSSMLTYDEGNIYYKNRTNQLKGKYS